MSVRLEDLLPLFELSEAQFDEASNAKSPPPDAGEAAARHASRTVEHLGLDPKKFQQGWAAPIDRSDWAFSFLLQGTQQNLPSPVLDCLTQALVEGNKNLDLTDRPFAKEMRRQFTPSHVRGSHVSAAAQEGYELARQVRHSLRLYDFPIYDLVRLIEERIGIPIVRAKAQDLHPVRAAAVVSASRQRAVIVHAPTSAMRLKDGSARFELAHELCHVLFDPMAEGQVQISTDKEAGFGTSNNTDLIEARANGFAAEFLAPQGGLIRLLGEPKRDFEIDPGRASEMVHEARKRFGLPFKSAVHQIHNHKWIPRWMSEHLLAPVTAPQPLRPAYYVDLQPGGGHHWHRLLPPEQAVRAVREARMIEATENDPRRGAAIVAVLAEDFWRMREEVGLAKLYTELIRLRAGERLCASVLLHTRGSPFATVERAGLLGHFRNLLSRSARTEQQVDKFLHAVT